MGRKRTSAAEDVIDLTAMFSWWIGIVLAIVSFVILRIVASIEVIPTGDAKQIGGLLIKQSVKAFAGIGQWLLPLLFSLGALFSFIKQRKRETLYAENARSRNDRGLSAMSWQDFERLVGEHFKRRGFSVLETGGAGADGGIDLELKKGSDRYLVQCKHWKALRVGVEPVRQLYGVMAARRAAGAFVVTSGSFTDEAQRFADGREIELIDGASLTAAIRSQPEKGVVQSPPVHAPKVVAVPTCPKCNEEMVLRRAKTGALAGQAFWGCSKFPGCRGTRPS